MISRKNSESVKYETDAAQLTLSDLSVSPEEAPLLPRPQQFAALRAESGELQGISVENRRKKGFRCRVFSLSLTFHCFTLKWFLPHFLSIQYTFHHSKISKFFSALNWRNSNSAVFTSALLFSHIFASALSSLHMVFANSSFFDLCSLFFIAFHHCFYVTSLIWIVPFTSPQFSHRHDGFNKIRYM